MSGLPSGYTQLEYIQSSGTQYVDTGIKPDQTYTLEVQFQTAQTSAGGIAVSDENWQSNGFGIWCNAVAFGNQTSQDVTLNGSEVITAKLSQAGLVVNGETVWTPTAATFTAAANMTFMALNRNGSISERCSGRLYYAKLTSSGTLIRDFLPCKNASGAVGLYDTVEEQFYANAGTGSFTAGPEIIPDPPAAPTGLQTVLAVVLQWAASANVDRYDVYRDGAKLGSTEGTQYVDATPEANQTYVYTVKAVNGGGESAGTSITVYTKSGYFEYKPLIESANFP